MKKIHFLILITAVISLNGCKYKKQAEQLEIEKQDLISQLEASRSESEAYLAVLNNAEVSLKSVLPEGMVTGEAGEDITARLKSTVSDITSALADSEERYRTMRNRYSSSSSRIARLEARIDTLNLLAEEREKVIAGLNQEIAGLNRRVEEQNSKISQLNGENKARSDTIRTITNRLNSAWYIAGTETDLREKGIVLKTGGFLGFLGRVNTLNPQLDKSRMEMVDIRDKTSLTLTADIRKLEFVTAHPAGSYEIIEGDAGTLVINITDPEKFWQGSNYLVIII